MKDLGSRSWFTVKMKTIRAESTMTSPDSIRYLSQAIMENDQLKRNHTAEIERGGERTGEKTSKARRD